MRERGRQRGVLCVCWVHTFGDLIFSNSLEVYFSHLKYILVVTIWSPKSGREKLLSNLFLLLFFSFLFPNHGDFSLGKKKNLKRSQYPNKVDCEPWVRVNSVDIFHPLPSAKGHPEPEYSRQPSLKPSDLNYNLILCDASVPSSPPF